MESLSELKDYLPHFDYQYVLAMPGFKLIALLAGFATAMILGGIFMDLRHNLGRIRMKFQATDAEKEWLAGGLMDLLLKRELAGKLTKRRHKKLYSRLSRVLELPDTIKPHKKKGKGWCDRLKFLIRWRMANEDYTPVKFPDSKVHKFRRRGAAA